MQLKDVLDTLRVGGARTALVTLDGDKVVSLNVEFGPAEAAPAATTEGEVDLDEGASDLTVDPVREIQRRNATTEKPAS